MSEKEISPDGKWTWIETGWLYLESDENITPDGIWDFSTGVFTRTEHKNTEQVLNSNIHDTVVTGDLNSNTPQGDINDSVVMGDYNVTINQNAEPEMISKLIKDVMKELGIGINNLPNNLSPIDKQKISNTIDIYDSKSEDGVEFDVKTEFLIANAVRASGNLKDALLRFQKLINDHPGDKLVPDARLCISKIFIRERNFAKAKAELKLASDIFTSHNNWEGAANCLLTHGNLEAERQQLVAAEALYKQAIKLSKAKNISGILIRSQTNLGILYWQNKEFDKSKSTLREALIGGRSSNDIESVRRIESTLSKISIEQSGPFGSNNRNFRVNSNLIDDEFSRIDADYDEAKMHESRGNFDTAVKGFESCIERYKKLDSFRNIGEVYSSLGSLQEEMNNYDLAADSFRQGAQSFANASDVEGRIHMMINLGGCLMETQKFAESLDVSLQAYHLASDNEFFEYIRDSLINIGISKSNLGLNNDASDAFNEARHIAKEHSLDDSIIPSIH